MTGLPTSLLVGPKIVRTRLLQDQRQAPGGKQGLERPAIEEANDAALDRDADGAGDEEGERHRNDERIIEQRRDCRCGYISCTTNVV